VVASRPQTAHLLQRLHALLVAPKGQTGLRQHKGTAQMLGMRALGARVLDGGLVSAQAEAAEREQMGGVGAAGLDGVQAAG
jgi:hypothetical protein